MPGMQPTSTAQAHAIGSRIYGVRLLYQPHVQRVVARLCLLVCGLDFLFQVASGYIGLPQKNLKYDFEQFRRAALDIGAGRNPYQYFLDLHCSAWCLGGYIYTPLVAFVMTPLNGLSDHAAAGVWIATSQLLVLATIVILYLGLRRDVSPTALALLLAAGLVFQPLFDNFNFLQIGAILLAVMAGAAVLYLRGKATTSLGAGALVALAAVIRVTPVTAIPALLPVGWLSPSSRARGGSAREVAAALAGLVLVCGVLVGTMLLLIPYTDQFFTQVLPRIGGGVGAFQNKSFAGLVNESLFLFGAPQPPAAVLALVTLLLFIAPPVVLAARASSAVLGERAVRAAYFGALVAAMPIVSTITWRHHMLVSYLAVVLLAVALWPRSGFPASRNARWLLVLAYLLMYVDQPLLDALALGGGITNPTTFDIVRALVIEYANLWGMVALWLASLLVLLAAATPQRGSLAPGRA